MNYEMDLFKFIVGFFMGIIFMRFVMSPPKNLRRRKKKRSHLKNGSNGVLKAREEKNDREHDKL